MVLELKLRKVGNSVGVVLPKEALTYLNVQEGDTVCVTESADGTLRMSPTKAEVTRQMKVAEARRATKAFDQRTSCFFVPFVAS